MVTDSKGIKWVTPQEAADILGLSRGHIYHLRDHLTHKKGKRTKSRLHFRLDRLFEDYNNMS